MIRINGVGPWLRLSENVFGFVFGNDINYRINCTTTPIVRLLHA